MTFSGLRLPHGSVGEGLPPYYLSPLSLQPEEGTAGSPSWGATGERRQEAGKGGDADWRFLRDWSHPTPSSLRNWVSLPWGMCSGKLISNVSQRWPWRSVALRRLCWMSILQSGVGVPVHRELVFLTCCCCCKLPPTGWFRTTHVDYLRVWKPEVSLC